ncbi:cyclase family protein [Tepidibacter hydrothermalis]|uniref:Cyclase family protein n=1 Tax=Tepidibacter hydrothermalis TaxID=3036126 RepID=A0ABY8E9N2_9FIRM|nr:cyclase family protein [Tepidibacter hydrothermalis]WFD09632.1 cyclase family protein [Tepidibacter hydrothermalis]
MIVDITQVTKINRVYRAGSPPLKVEKVKCFEGTKKEYTTTLFSCAVHNMGTHIDVMGKDVVLENERLIASGIKFDVSHITDRPVEIADLDFSEAKQGDFVFFQTNWDQYLNDEEKYNAHPEISMEVMEYLVEKKVNMIGIDTLGLGRGKNHGLIDVFLGKSGIYAIENLTNLNKIPKNNFRVFCLPMKIEGLDALPARIMVEF